MPFARINRFSFACPPLPLGEQEEGQTLADCSTDHTSKTRQILGKCCSESTARALRVRAEGLGYMSGAERGYMTFTRGKRITSKRITTFFLATMTPTTFACKK